MNKTLGVLLVIVVAFLGGAIVYDVWFADDEPASVACSTQATRRYTEDELHAAYEMTRSMSRDDAAPMWHDQQLERSLTDPGFVAELEAHLCRMQQMRGER
jgi:hypothetical protein